MLVAHVDRTRKKRSEPLYCAIISAIWTHNKIMRSHQYSVMQDNYTATQLQAHNDGFTI